MTFNFIAPLHVILAQRLWQAVSGLVTIIMVTSFLDPAQQGWYFSLLSLAALYTLFDLGLSFVLVQAAAHAFISLRWTTGGAVEGKNAELFTALTAWSARHYVWLALGFALVIIPAGLLFFSTTPAAGISWTSPWLLLATSSALALLFLPFTAVVEGSGDVREVYTLRLIQGVVAALACWIMFLSGAGLWAVAMQPLAAIAVQGIWLIRWRPALLSSALRGSRQRIAWRQDIWPHQWQLGLGWICGYLLTMIYTPVLFKLQNPVIAGQMGLTLTVSNMLGLLALSWITRHVPAMAKAVASRDWNRFDALRNRDFMLSCIAFLAGAALLCLIHWILSGTSYAGRLLPFWPFAGVLAAGFLGYVQSALAAQLRSFRREPLIWVSFVSAILTASGAIWGAMHYSATGVVVAMLIVQVIFVLPASVIIWQKCLRDLRSRTGDSLDEANHTAEKDLSLLSRTEA